MENVKEVEVNGRKFTVHKLRFGQVAQIRDAGFVVDMNTGMAKMTYGEMQKLRIMFGANLPLKEVEELDPATAETLDDEIIAFNPPNLGFTPAVNLPTQTKQLPTNTFKNSLTAGVSKQEREEKKNTNLKTQSS